MDYKSLTKKRRNLECSFLLIPGIFKHFLVQNIRGQKLTKGKTKTLNKMAKKGYFYDFQPKNLRKSFNINKENTLEVVLSIQRILSPFSTSTVS